MAGQTIRVKDVAEMRGSDQRTRQKISDLDLHEFLPGQVNEKLTAAQVNYRVLLAGYTSEDFRFSVDSAEYVSLIDARHYQLQIEHEIKEQCATIYGIASTAIELHLVTSPIELLGRTNLDASTLMLDAKLPLELPIGQKKLTIEASDDYGNKQTLVATFKIAVYRDLAIVRATVPAGHMIDETMVERSRRIVDTPHIEFANYEHVVGSQAQTDLSPNSLVPTRSINRRVNPAKLPVVIRRNSNINVIMQQGALVVTLKNARAMQDGRVGETIDVLNPKTKKTIRATVVDATTAKIAD
ncbi:MAG TPA: flagellar basal body P-ring formation chaperone FlgA [Pirellulaceae bacterium]|nr:flagellar basal body P-ring formation chaperone FlgA [Pirellulaceae bacterium]